MTTAKIKMLRHLPFLEGTSPDVVERLAQGVIERSFQPGQVILQEGSTGREMYLIIEGQVEVVKGCGAEEMVLARYGQAQGWRDYTRELEVLDSAYAVVRVYMSNGELVTCNASPGGPHLVGRHLPTVENNSAT